MPNILNLYEETQGIVKEVKEIADAMIKEECDKIADVGNPEDLVHKPYARWTPQDKQILNNIYVYDRKPLERFAKSKEIDMLFESIKRNEV